MSQRISLPIAPAFACCAALLPACSPEEVAADRDLETARAWRESLTTPPGSLLAAQTRLWICLNAALDAPVFSPLEQAALEEWARLTDGLQTSAAEKREACETAAGLARLCGKDGHPGLAASFSAKAIQYRCQELIAGIPATPAP